MKKLLIATALFVSTTATAAWTYHEMPAGGTRAESEKGFVHLVCETNGRGELRLNTALQRKEEDVRVTLKVDNKRAVTYKKVTRVSGPKGSVALLSPEETLQMLRKMRDATKLSYEIKGSNGSKDGVAGVKVDTLDLSKTPCNI